MQVNLATTGRGSRRLASGSDRRLAAGVGPTTVVPVGQRRERGRLGRQQDEGWRGAWGRRELDERRQRGRGRAVADQVAVTRISWWRREVDRRRPTYEEKTRDQCDGQHEHAAASATAWLDDGRAAMGAVELGSDRQTLAAAATERCAGGVASSAIGTDQEITRLTGSDSLGSSQSIGMVALRPLLAGLHDLPIWLRRTSAAIRFARSVHDAHAWVAARSLRLGMISRL